MRQCRVAADPLVDSDVDLRPAVHVEPSVAVLLLVAEGEDPVAVSGNLDPRPSVSDQLVLDGELVLGPCEFGKLEIIVLVSSFACPGLVTCEVYRTREC